MNAVAPLLMLLLVHPTGIELSDAARNEVIAAWRARQDATRSVRFSWSKEGENAGDSSGPKGNFVLVGEKSRFWAECPHLNEGRDLFGENGYRGSSAFRQALESRFEASHGGARSTLFERTRDGRQVFELIDAGDEMIRGTHRTVGLEADTGIVAVEALSDRPLLLTYRPLGDAGFSIDSMSCMSLRDTSSVDGADCLVLDERRVVDTVEVRRRYWVDPKRDFVVLRVIVGRDDRDVYQIDIRYMNDPSDGPVPVWWHVMVFPDGPERFPGQHRLFQAAAFTVTEYTINTPASEQETDARIPEGTVITDRTSGRSYVSLQGGGRRYLGEGEALAMSLAGGVTNRGANVFARYAIGAFVAVAAVGLLWWRRSRRRGAMETISDGRTYGY